MSPVSILLKHLTIHYTLSNIRATRFIVMRRLVLSILCLLTRSASAPFRMAGVIRAERNQTVTSINSKVFFKSSWRSQSTSLFCKKIEGSAQRSTLPKSRHLLKPNSDYVSSVHNFRSSLISSNSSCDTYTHRINNVHFQQQRNGCI
jgi:hypothetical protein